MKRLRAEFDERSVAFALAHVKFLDETGLNLALTPRYGRAARGVRVVDRVPQNYGENLSVLAALSLSGLSAPMSVEGAVDTAVFQTYIEQVLGPTLQLGDIVVMDNLAVHKVTGIAQALAARGARVEYLPPYSPALNPIEKCWAKLKTALRQAKARTRETLEEALAQALQTISADDALAWFAHCGYPVH
jgi:transposase